MPATKTKPKAKVVRSRRATKEAVEELAPPFALPIREWDRATELVSMFALTGFVANSVGAVKPQSLLLISEPGSGKTELVDRFKPNSFLRYASDLTSRGLYPVLKAAKSGAVTHIVATEFQKLMLRRNHTAEATLGLLCQAMEEGVGEMLIGDHPVDFGGARLGIIGAITHDTVSKWKSGLRELGFWSRCAGFEWQVSLREMQGVLRSITREDRTDLAPVLLKTPSSPVRVEFPTRLSEQFETFVFENFKEYTPVRLFNRFRCLAQACALLDGRDRVKACDVEKVVAFQPYWSKMQR